MRRWIVPIVLVAVALLLLRRPMAPVQVFASDQERRSFLEMAGEPEDIALIALVTEWCPACKALEATLSEIGRPYAIVDIERSEAGRMLFERCARESGSRAVPKVVLGLEMMDAREAVARMRQGPAPHP